MPQKAARNFKHYLNDNTRKLSHETADNAFHIIIIHNAGNGISGISLFKSAMNKRGQILFFDKIKGGGDIHIRIKLFDCGDECLSFFRFRRACDANDIRQYMAYLAFFTIVFQPLMGYNSYIIIKEFKPSAYIFGRFIFPL